MAISVDIADRQFDYTDEEKAAEAVADVQSEKGLSDEQVIAAWSDEGSSLRAELERRIYDAVDANGSAQRARETVPGGITLMVDAETA
jgi:hypothetical protein